LAAAYVPQPVYPNGYDTDRTLYKVTNFGETVLSEDLPAWSNIINVTPVSRNEIWPENGYVTIKGELIYYDNIVKDPSSGKVIQLIKCIRNINNVNPYLYKKNTDVRQFVIAQHHNSLARAIVNLQNLLGYENNTDIKTIDRKIKTINNIISLGDDCECPQANFSYNIVSTDTSSGTIISYSLVIYGKFNSFRIDFGDGKATTTSSFGTHTYPPNIPINPAVRIFQNACDCAQTTPTIDSTQNFIGSDLQLYDTGFVTLTTGGQPTGISSALSGQLSNNNNNNLTTIVTTGNQNTATTTAGGGTGGNGGGTGGTGGGTGGDTTGSINGTGSNALGDVIFDLTGGDVVTDTDLRDGTVAPTLCEFPDFDFDTLDWGYPERDLQLPPIVFPALDAKFGPISVPSTIEIVGQPSIPSVIKIDTKNSIPSFISFGALPNIPSFISIVQIDPIPSFIEMGSTELELLSSEYCVNCTPEIKCDNVTKEVIEVKTNDGCRPCQYHDDGARADGNEIEKVQVVVHDFFVSDEYDEGSNRWDAVKILVRDPIGKTCLVMGGGPAKYDPDTIPKYNMSEPVTLTFDDKAAGSIYKYDRKLVGGTFQTSPNGNWQKNDDGIADLTPPAPTAPYGTFISDYTDKKLPAGLWRAYVVVGDGPTTNCTGCKWESRIIGLTNAYPNPSYIYDWRLMSDCGPDCNCPEPKTLAKAGATATTPCKGNVPPPEYVIPITNVSISKICIRIYYSSQEPPCPDPTPTPTPTATKKASLAGDYVPLPTPTPQPTEIPKSAVSLNEENRPLTKKELFEKQSIFQGNGPIDIFKEIEIPFIIHEIETIPTNLQNNSEQIVIKSNLELQYGEKINNNTLIVPKSQSINVDVNNLFGEK
jgi:hypothetical protein